MGHRDMQKIITAVLLLCSCVAYGQSTDKANVRTAIDMRNGMELDSVASKVASASVVYVGETHDSYADHLTQLEIIRRLHLINPNIAIGMEQFQQPFQKVLDGFINGELSEHDLVRNSEWMDRWRYDFRLYRPILSYARDNHIPVIALNVAQEIVAKVSEKGIDGLSKEDKKKIPKEIDDSDQEYRDRLKEIYEQHPHKGKHGFDGFLQVQLLWDESMAAKAAEYMRANPERQLVVLAGTGHLLYGAGIPQRVSRRVKAERAIILPAGDFPLDQNIADFLVQGGEEQLPERGLLGIFMEDSAEGVVVKDLSPEGAAAKAGVEQNDLIRSFNGKPIKDVVDIKLLLLDKSPGEMVDLTVLRRNLIQKDEELELRFRLLK